MAEIIRPRFGSGPRPVLIPEPEPEAKLGNTSEDIAKELFIDIGYYLANRETVRKVSPLIDITTDYIFSLKGFSKNDVNIELRREGLKRTSFELLCKYLIDGNESTWRTNPFFYGAVILEIDERNKIILAAMEDTSTLDASPEQLRKIIDAIAQQIEDALKE